MTMVLSFYSPPIRPADEARRQAAVEQCGILARPDEPALQAIVARAAALFGAPIAALSIIDRHRQWFAARLGMTTRETSRAVSFCAHAILEPDRVLVVPDATRDRRFSGNPLVIGAFGLRFYAGAPLRAAMGDTLGALCVVDTRPRRAPSDRIEALAALGREAMAVIAALDRDRPAA